VHPRAPRRATTTATAQLPCRYYPELFFAEHPQDLEWAKTLCRRCPIRAACLAGALERGEPCGVWGGELLLNGKVIDGKRPRGRPRKAA
jgi:WhiB family redox-sensing transcriptional regulator